MARVAPAVPADSSLLCEQCGYIIDGIALDSRCPECATPIVQSLPTVRRPPIWEQSSPPALVRFMITTAQLIFRPKRFFRSITPRGDARASARFARLHHWLTSLIIGSAAFVHASWAWKIMLFEWRVRWLQRSTAHMLAAMMVIAIFTL